MMSEILCVVLILKYNAYSNPKRSQKSHKPKNYCVFSHFVFINVPNICTNFQLHANIPLNVYFKWAMLNV